MKKKDKGDKGMIWGVDLNRIMLIIWRTCFFREGAKRKRLKKKRDGQKWSILTLIFQRPK